MCPPFSLTQVEALTALATFMCAGTLADRIRVAFWTLDGCVAREWGGADRQGGGYHSLELGGVRGKGGTH